MVHRSPNHRSFQRRNQPGFSFAVLCGLSAFLMPLPLTPGGQATLAAAELAPVAALAPAVQKSSEQNTLLVTVASSGVSRSSAGYVAATGQVLTSFSLCHAGAWTSNTDGNLDCPELAGLTFTVRAGTGADAKRLTAKLAWYSAADDLAILKVEGLTQTPLHLDPKAAPQVKDTLYVTAFSAASAQSAPDRENELPAAAATLVEAQLTPGPAGGLPLLDFGAAKTIPYGAPLFNDHGQFVGIVTQSAAGKASFADASRLNSTLYGSIRKVETQPANYNPGAGGPLTVIADVDCALNAPRSITVQAGSNARPVTLRLNSKTNKYEGTLNLPATAGAIDVPVDESKLPATAKLNYHLDPNSMVGKNSHAKADSLYVGDFFNQFIEITTATAGRKKIYFSALVHATFTSDGAATVLTTDNRTLTGKLETKFTYQVSGTTMKWTCGAEQITYIEVPNAKAADKKAELALKLSGTGSDGSPLPPFETTLK